MRHRRDTGETRPDTGPLSGSGRGCGTLQAADEPHELLLGDVGVPQVEGDGLAADHPAQHGGGDGALPAQVDPGPQPLVTTPEEEEEEEERWCHALTQVCGVGGRGSPTAPGATHPHAHAQLPLAQVGEHPQPHVPRHDVGGAGVQGQAAGLGAGGGRAH